MPPTMTRHLRRFSLLLAAVVAGATLPSAHAAASVAEDIRMAGDSVPFRQAAEAFVARSIAGDVPGTYAMLSRRLVERSGDAAIRQALQAQILPFFRNGRGVGRSATITHTTDAAGQQGFAFYLWMEYADGATARPFTVYVVDEQGRPVVANIVPDRLVEGRHR